MVNLIIIGAANPNIIRLIDDKNASSNQDYNILGLVDNNWAEIGESAWGHKVLKGFDSLSNFDRTNTKLINAIAGNIQVRRETTEFFVQRGWSFVNLVHPRTSVSYVKMGIGNIFYEGALVQPYVEIGDHCIFSAGSIIAHNTKLGNFCFIGPNTTVSGHVAIGDGVYFGVGATILPRLHIGNNVNIAACSLVTKDVLNDAKVKGLPARRC